MGDWSRDDSQIISQKIQRNADQNFVVNADGTHLRSLPLTVANTESGTFSRDGKFLYLTGFQTTPNLETWRITLENSPQNSSPKVAALPWMLRPTANIY